MKKDFRKIPLKHDVVIGSIAAVIIKTILRYLLMAGYIYACDRFGLYDHGLVVKIIVTITSIIVSRMIIREIGKIFWNEMDEPPFQSVGIVACIRDIRNMLDRW